jgi:hypothetical protein
MKQFKAMGGSCTSGKQRSHHHRPRHC